MEAVIKRVLELFPLIERAAARHKLDPHILGGLVCQESGGDTWAARPEPLYRWLFGDQAHERRRLKIPLWRSLQQDHYMQRVSYGLCQVMGAVAREYGHSGYLTELCRPKTGLDYGAKHLKNKLRQVGGDLNKALLLYNGGGDKQYPAKVMKWAGRIKEARK